MAIPLKKVLARKSPERRARIEADAKRMITRLSPKDWDAFNEVLDNPPKPNKALKRLLRKKPTWG